MKKFEKIKVIDKNIFSYRLKHQMCKSIIKNSSFEFYLKKQRLPFIMFEDQSIFFPFLEGENNSRLL
jgi:5-methylcytosine-specific restriction endonuclease McrBC regulatory subunit McrC